MILLWDRISPTTQHSVGHRLFELRMEYGKCISDLCKNTCLKNYNNIIISITVIYAMIFLAGAVRMEFASLAKATNNVVIIVLIISAT